MMRGCPAGWLTSTCSLRSTARRKSVVASHRSPLESMGDSALPDYQQLAWLVTFPKIYPQAVGRLPIYDLVAIRCAEDVFGLEIAIDQLRSALNPIEDIAG